MSTLTGNAAHYSSLRGAERRSNLLPDEPRNARQAGDCFVALLLAMTAGSTIPVRMEML
jgi:hypothetical protein